MISRARELLAELVDVARCVRALPHVIETCRELELRVARLEADRDTHGRELARINAIAEEVYLCGPRCDDAEVPDA